VHSPKARKARHRDHGERAPDSVALASGNRVDATPKAGANQQGYGAWTLIGVDALKRRAQVICVCGTQRQISVEVLKAGESLGCGCRETPLDRRLDDPKHVRFWHADWRRR
jgi:hypothetical protein